MRAAAFQERAERNRYLTYYLTVLPNKNYSSRAADAATDQERPHHEQAAEEHHPSAPFEPQGTAERLGSPVGAALAPAAQLGKPSLFPSQAPEPAPAPRSSAHTGKRAKRRRAPSEHHAADHQPEAQAALEARKAALIAAWLAHPVTVPEAQMSETERRRFYSGIAKLAHSSLTLEELPALLDAQARL